MYCRFDVSALFVNEVGDHNLSLRCQICFRNSRENRAHVTGAGRSLIFFQSKVAAFSSWRFMLFMYSREIEILHEIAIAPIPPHAEKSGYLRDWNARLVTSLRQRISLPTFEGTRGLYLTRSLMKKCYTSQSVDTEYIPDTRYSSFRHSVIVIPFQEWYSREGIAGLSRCHNS